MTSPTIIWDIGTAYDFFVSLIALHDPSQFAIRGSWAVGVRSRLPQEERDFLQEVSPFVGWPLDWIYTLPAPKNAQTVLDILSDMTPRRRLFELTACNESDPIDQILLDVAARGSYDDSDLAEMKQRVTAKHGKKKAKDKLSYMKSMLKWYAAADEFGDRYHQALSVYHDVFFAEDEQRLMPALEASLAKAQEMSQELSLGELLRELSHGIEFDELPQSEELVLAPTFWGSPLILFGKNTREREVILFGGRPANASIVPGEAIPDALNQSLKALADPTRLRILQYLVKEPLTPTELATRLRLRAPTVVHHLQTLRLARLVYVTFGMEGKRYRARHEAVKETYSLLNEFLGTD